MMMGMGFGFLGMLLLSVVPLALVIGGAAWVLRQTTGVRPLDGAARPTARQVLNERFARGEIDVEEYEAIRAQIER